MAMIQVHNISDRPNTSGKAQTYIIGGKRVSPGKHLVVDNSVINRTLKKLHGTRLWFGPLHSRFARTSKSAQKAQAAAMGRVSSRPMEVAEAKVFLAGLELSDLQDLCGRMTPALEFRRQVSRPALLARLSRALFQPSRELDPEHFFWLRRWKKVRGDFLTVET